MELSYSVVFYNDSEKKVRQIYRNLIEMTPQCLNFKIYFINNSPDNKRLSNYISKIASQDNHVISIVAKENRGFGAGNNLAINQISSDFHIVLNPDVLIPDSHQIGKMIDFMEQKSVVLLSPLILSKDGKVQKLVKHQPSMFDMAIRFLGDNFFPKRQKWFTFENVGYDKVHEGNNFPGSFLVFKTSVLKLIGGFDERFFLYMEDSDVCRAMSKKGKCMFFPGAYVIHEWQRNNRNSLKGFFQMVASMVKYFDKWGWKIW